MIEKYRCTGKEAERTIIDMTVNNIVFTIVILVPVDY